MRTTTEILDAARNNEPLDTEECRYALLVLESLFCTAARHYRNFAFAEPARSRVAMGMIADTAHRSARAALSTDPQTYLGPDNDPKSKTVRARKAAAARVMDVLVAAADSKEAPDA